MKYDIYLIKERDGADCYVYWTGNYEDINYLFSLIGVWNDLDPYNRKWEVREQE